MIEKLKEYYIDNTTATNQIITLKKETDCGVYEDVTETQQIATALSVTKIVFPSDGVYEVYVNAVLDGVAKYYLGLFTSMIVYVGAALCKNFSSTCAKHSTCGDDINYVNNAISKSLLYYANNTTTYDAALLSAIGKVRCSSIDIWGNLSKSESYLGVSDTEELSLIELAHLYLEMYKIDKGVVDLADSEALDTLYNYDKIEYCISKLGVLDCTTAVVPGSAHTKTLTAAPTTLGLGEPTTITLTYKFTANSDTFLSVIDSNIPNVDLSKLDGFTHAQQILGETTSKTYYITYSYDRSGTTYQDTVSVSTTAYSPQWFGGEATDADFAGVGGLADTTLIKAAITNISPTYQTTSNSTSSNTNTTGKYIWWITSNPIKFYVGQFEILTGTWSASCDPNSFAIIHKTITTKMDDGVTTKVLHFYRTCPLQELTGVTLDYTLIQTA